ATNEVDACYATGPNNVLTDPADPTGRFLCKNSLPTGTALPVAPACRSSINSLCRITIHYEKHIHPLWGVDRFVDANTDGVPDVDGGGVTINHKCTSCHAPVNAAAAAAVPAGQLDLSDGPSEAEPLQFNAYRQLLFGHVAQQLNADMTALEPICVRTEVD